MPTIKQIVSGARVPGNSGPIEKVEVGSPGMPSQIITHNGKIFIYNPQGQTLIDSGIIYANALEAKTITTEKLRYANKQFVVNLTWTNTNYRKVSWSSGTINWGDGTSTIINAGNTGDMTATTYVYFDNSPNLLKSTNLQSVVGGNKALVAIITPAVATDDNPVINTFGSIGTTIDGGKITTGKINSFDLQTYFDLNNSVLVMNDGDDNRIKLGKTGATEFSLKISKKGEDVDVVATKLLRFFSDAGAFKIFEADDASFTTDGSGDGIATINHNLGYAPGFFVFRKATARWDLVSGSNEYTNAFFPIGSHNRYVKDDDLHHAIHAYADEDNLYIRSYGGTPSLAMNFRYYLLVDQSETFSGDAGISLANDYGFKVSKPGFDVLTAKEYQMAFSSKYKILQYYDVSKKSETLTLPEMWASYHDQSVEEATYVDFVHGLGYAPLFTASFISPYAGDILISAPLTFFDPLDIVNYEVAGWADSTRIRIYFWRVSYWNPFVGASSPIWDAETINIKITIYTENLAGAAFPPA